MENSKWNEIVINYFDTENLCYLVDGWTTENKNEEGLVIAKILTNENDKVEYIDENAKTDVHAQKVISEFIKDMKNDDGDGPYNKLVSSERAIAYHD